VVTLPQAVPSELDQALQQLRSELNPELRINVAFSGGMDSTVLLNLVSHFCSKQHQIRAIHIHHGVSSDADLWVDHCQYQCDQLAVELVVCRVKVDPDAADGHEAACRTARYQAFEALLSEKDILLMAHHQDDQIETLLLNLFRGSGIRGLSAMPGTRPFARSVLCRPLLGVAQSALRHCADSWGLNWIEDPSNQLLKYRRNWLRHQLLPDIEQHIPGVRTALMRVVENCKDEWQLIQPQLQAELAGIQGENLSVLKLPGLLKFKLSRQNQLLIEWVRQLGLPPPNRQHLQQIHQMNQSQKKDIQPLVDWPGCEIRRHRSLLFASKPISFPTTDQFLDWSGPVLTLPGDAGYLCWESDQDDFIPPHLKVCFGVKAARIKLANASHHRRLKNLFQEHQVPVWERRLMPYIFQGETLIAVGDLWYTQQLLDLQQHFGALLVWRKQVNLEAGP